MEKITAIEDNVGRRGWFREIAKRCLVRME